MAYDEILQWSEKQADWTRDALCRLAQANGRKLSEEAANDVLQRLKHAHGIVSEPAPACTLLTADHLPKNTNTQRAVLCSIGSVKNLNRLAEGQTLPFGINGITLIYGDNGSGKSGYSRLTKKLCRTLSVDALLGNVFEAGESKNAEAVIRYKPDGAETVTEETWVDGTTPPAAIANISVFDSKNAGLYIDRDNKIQYLPPEIDLMERYAGLLQVLAEQVEKEAGEISRHVSVPLPTGFMPGTAISELIAPLIALSQKKGGKKGVTLPSIDALRSAAEWNETLEQELADLEASLRDDPAIQAQKFQRVASVLTSLSDELKEIEACLSADNIEKIKTLTQKFIATKGAAANAASEIFAKEPLPHTGSDAWKLMYGYAKQYALLVTGKEDGSASANDLCALCQQTLSPEAAARLQKFEDFVADKANKDAEAAAEDLKAVEIALQNLKFRATPELERQLAEYAAIDATRKATGEGVVKFSNAALALRDALLAAIESNDFTKIEALADPVSKSLDDDAAAIVDTARAFEVKGKEGGNRMEDRNRLALLKDQKKLSQEIETFAARLSDLQVLEKLADCKSALSTAAVSSLITKLRKKLVTDDLQGRIQTEITAFNLDHIPFSVRDRSEGGKSVVGVKLQSVAEVANRDVLSEGEQRALGLACFLGEILGDPVKHGAIIDDPVSSLDHIRIRRVAERLVREAAEGRQIIIFTHNLIFYSEVMFAAARNEPQVLVLCHCIRKDEAKGFGIIHANDAPWIAKKVKDRLHLLRSERLPIFKDRTDGDTEKYRKEVTDFYTDLRETWERFVEEVLLGGVVERFNNEVKTQSLKGVVVDDDDYQTIFFAMKRVSERSGHDTAAGRTIPTPTYDEMNKDLEVLESFKKKTEGRAKERADARKDREKPPLAEVA